MNTFFLAPALVQLRDEVNARYPDRDTASDGWIGDASHAARPSDHNPCWSCSGRYNGIVRAIDIDITPDGRPNIDLRRHLLRNVVGDPRVWYVISNGKIYSRTYGWVARTYTGSNPHTAHVHISLNGANGIDPSGNFSTAPWFPAKHKAEPEVGVERIENFRESRPKWDVKILDRVTEQGRRDIGELVKDIERVVDGLPDDLKETRVKEFKDRFANRRVLDMELLNQAVKDGRMSRVQAQRDKLRAIIKKIVR